MAISYECDNCGDEVNEADVIVVTVTKNNVLKATNHADQECFDLALKGDEAAVEALLLG